MITLNYQISKKQKAMLAFEMLSNNFDVSLSNNNPKNYTTKQSFTIFVHLNVEQKRKCDIEQCLEYFKNVNEFMKKLGFETFDNNDTLKKKISNTNKNDIICIMYDLY